MCKLASTTELAPLHAIITCSMITAQRSASKPRVASEGSDICVHAETTVDLHLLTYTLMVRPRTHVASVYRKPKSDTDAAHDTLQDFCRRTQQITEKSSANKSRGMYVARAVRYTRNIVFGSSRPGPCLLAFAEGSIATVATPKELWVVRRHFGTCGTFRRKISNSRGASTNARGEPPECDTSHRTRLLLARNVHFMSYAGDVISVYAEYISCGTHFVKHIASLSPAHSRPLPFGPCATPNARVGISSPGRPYLANFTRRA